MMRRRNFLKTVMAAAVPAAIIGSKAKAAAKVQKVEFGDHLSLLDSVGNDRLLIRKQAAKWVVLHREPKSKFTSSGGYKVHYGGHVFIVEAITSDANGKMGLFMLWRKA